MKNAKLFHGTGCGPDSYWLPFLKRELEQRSYQVSVPQLPDTDTPVLARWLPTALAQEPFTQDTVMVGHSAGSPLVLSVLERLSSPIRMAILVAGYARQRPGKKEKDSMIQDVYDWERIKRNAGELFFINSVNDPWGCTDQEARYMFERLGGIMVINHDGHMGSDTYNQPYKEFPLLVRLIG